MQDLLVKLRNAGIRLELEGDDLKVAAPKGGMTPELRVELKSAKGALTELLRRKERGEDVRQVTPRPDLRHEPFGLTEIQHAYWIGRNEQVELGGFSTHFYVELERTGLDARRLEDSLQRVIARHDMLRAVIEIDGRQRILSDVPPYGISLHDMRGKPAFEIDEKLAELRHEMSLNRFTPERWPLFDIQAVLHAGERLRLFISVDMLILDASSLFLFFEDWWQFYLDPQRAVPGFQLSYRDYVEFERTVQDWPSWQRARDYWMQRLQELPPAPALPLARRPGELSPVRFARRTRELPVQRWQRLKQQARGHGVTPSVLLMTAFCEVLRTWAREPDFTLNLTMYNRFPIHREVEALLGDFATTSLLAVHARAGEAFVERLRRLQQQFADDLEHRHYSGMSVLRERMRRLGSTPGAAMPVVFTSMLPLDGLRNADQGLVHFGDYVYGVTQTPQVWLDHQVIEWRDELLLVWDAVEELFPSGMLDDMWSAYLQLLERLADDEHAWVQRGSLVPLPEWQLRERQVANGVRRELRPIPLHELVAPQYERRGDALAVITPSRSLSYDELGAHAYRLAHRLVRAGVGRGSVVAVSMEKGWEQVVAVLGVLHAGAAYLPIDPDLPQERRHLIAGLGQVTVVITQAHLAQTLRWPAQLVVLSLDDAEMLSCDPRPPAVMVSPDELAYVLFTSGTTGVPKGVMLEHRTVSNTVQDMNARLQLTPDDKVLALSALHFDMSVYDMFGTLSAGGALVMPSPAHLADPAHWTELAWRHGVTLWNSVPQLLQLWLGHLQQSHGSHEALRWAVLGGDWIPLTLPDRLRNVCSHARVFASGGPTETSIYSTHYLVDEVSDHWNSIPYGKPLSNQTMHVCNSLFEDKPVWVTGEILVGGLAPARGYLDDARNTAERFISHPHTGERLYRTGDLGRYLPGGDIEFLGRDDFQVKINGYRIELGEIEAVLRRQPGVREAVVTVAASGEGQRSLVAHVVVDSSAPADAADLERQLAAVLPCYMVPHRYVRLAALPLSPNGKVDYQTLRRWRDPAQPEVARTKPRTDYEKRLFELWAELLGRADFGVEDSFFVLGADSLGLIGMIERARTLVPLSGVPQRLLLRRFFAAPTIVGFAAALEELVVPSQSQDVQGVEVASGTASLPHIVPDPANRHEPFPLTDLQRAYLAGQAQGMEYHVESNCYLEVDYDEWLDGERWELALNRMLARQRANLPVLNQNMQLQVPRKLAPVKLVVRDLRELPEGDAQAAWVTIRQELSHKVMPLDRWPWLAFQITLHRGGTRFHININNFFVDAFGLMSFEDVHRYYREEGRELPVLQLSCRDVVLAHQSIEQSAQGQRSRRYWLDRVESLPRPPAVPLVPHQPARTRSRLDRREMVLPEPIWAAFKRHAARFGLTATHAVYAVYAEVLARWSGSRHFLLSHLLTQRLPLHRDVRAIVGNFGAVYPLEVDWRAGVPFAERARGLQLQIVQDAQHVYWGSARIWQTLNQQSGTPGRAAAPYVVVSGLDLPPRDKPVFGCLDTPQVLIDHQVWHLKDGGFWAIWDVNERFFPQGLVDAMWHAYRALLTLLAQDESAWLSYRFDLLPAAQRDLRAQANAVTTPVEQGLLHASLAVNARCRPHKPAVISPTRRLSYRELDQLANRLGHRLRAAGVQPNELVALWLDKGCEQAVAVFGVLAAGAAYVPIDPNWPLDRVRYLLENTQARFVVTTKEQAERLPPSQAETVCVDDGNLDHLPDSALLPAQTADDLAYVIFTSGSTGNPKGVMISHRSALNTVVTVNRQLNVAETAVVFGVSALSFDLSVYDLFGTVAAGGTLVLPSASEGPDPIAWLAALVEHEVTVWNSVPSLMQLLTDAADASDVRLPSMKTVMLSGDWIPLALLPRIRLLTPQADLISLGGATEASIWSICYPIEEMDPSWVSVPYGKPLPNQSCHVLDEEGHDVPVWTVGHLYIGGAGLARGYWRDGEKTAAAFITDPRTGERLYRTGDRGRYLPDGNIEFLGRVDLQVKVHGHRIELGEIEHALLAHPAVESAVAVAPLTGGSRRLAAFVVYGDESADAEQIRQFLRHKLPAHMVPAHLEALKTFPLTANGKVDREALSAMLPLPSAASSAAPAPRTAIEAELVSIWEAVLGVAPVGVRDDFFALGGHSMAAIQAMARVSRNFGQPLSAGALIEDRTVEKLARRLLHFIPATPLVRVESRGEGQPLFLVHPAGGDVSCYLGLARSLERPVYALQPVGLPLEPCAYTVEQIAAAYVTALREVQAYGPYILGGWSSGGVLAFEMASQLESARQAVQQVLLLDTPAPLQHDDVDDRTLMLWFLRQTQSGSDHPIDGLEEQLAEDANASPELALTDVRKDGTFARFDSSRLKATFATFSRIIRATRHYRASPINADIWLWRAGEGAISEFTGHPAFGMADWGWRQLTRGVVRSKIVQGTHYTMLKSPNLQLLTRDIASALNELCSINFHGKNSGQAGSRKEES
nr:non-ribosomal peptide synthetase [uncultured Caldimonas sp.]